MDRIKILFLIDQIEKAGTESHLLLLAGALPASRFDCRIGVLSVSEFQRQLKATVPIVDLGVSTKWGFGTVRDLLRVARYIRRERFHIVQTHFNDSELIGTLATRLYPKRPRLVVTRRNNYHWTGEQPRMFQIIKRTRRLADHILANSLSVMEKCREYEGVGESGVSVIYNAVDTSLYDPEHFPDAKEKLGLAGCYPVIGVVANSRPVKGLFDFLDAAVIVRTAVPAATFVHIGSGPLDEQLRMRAEQLGLTPHVRFLGSRYDVPHVLPAFDVAVLPSHSEGFSNALIEYMADARPIVATDVGDAAWVIEHGIDGLLVPARQPQRLGGGIIALCQDPGMAREFGRRARERAVECWSVAKIIQQYQRFYEQLVDN